MPFSCLESGWAVPDMDEPLKQLSGHIKRMLAQEARPFYVILDPEGQLSESYGDGAYYGYSLKSGESAEAQFPFLVGLEALTAPSLKLEVVQTPSGKAANVHLLRIGQGWGIAFLDATRQRENQRHHQQLAHDLHLLGVERERLVREIEATNRELELANRLKTRFLGRMSHEFRTPLSSVLGFSDLAKEELGYPQRAMSHLKAIERGANYLLNLVDNLVDQAVVENSSLKIHPASCDLAAIVDDLEELFRPMAEKKGLSFAWMRGPDIPSRVWLDEIRFRQVLVNLLGNAFKFTRNGGITVSLDWEQERLTVSVDDTGPGINEEDIGQLFQAFRQSSNENHEGKGAGLGLSISQEIVQLMGGSMEISSPGSQGTSIRFTIDAPSRHEQEASASTLEGTPILVIDDDEDIRMLLEVFLAGAGSTPLLASNREEALQALTTHQPALILLDMQLNGESSLGLAKEIRANGFHAPLLALSANDSESMRIRAKRAGCDDYLLKPIRRNEFLERLQSVLC